MTTRIWASVGRASLAAGLAFSGIMMSSKALVAADMPVKAPVTVYYEWAGFYAGGNGGYSWGRSRTDDVFTLTADSLPFTAGSVAAIGAAQFNLNGAVAGGQVGYNWQSDRSVFGVEADLQWSGQKGSTTLVCPVPIVGGPCNTLVAALYEGLPPTVTFNQRLQWFGTARGRIGALVGPDMLVYLTGGLAYGAIKTDGVFTGYSAANGGTIFTSAYTQTATKAGWVGGAGIERRLFGRWTGKLEYLHIDLGTASGTATQPGNAPPLALAFSSRIRDNILRIGLNYRFDGPVVAKN